MKNFLFGHWVKIIGKDIMRQIDFNRYKNDVGKIVNISSRYGENLYSVRFADGKIFKFYEWGLRSLSQKKRVG